MIERVAEAIFKNMFPDATYSREHKLTYESAARAAIEVMREPTNEMKNVWYQQVGVTYYKAMIDAALK